MNRVLENATAIYDATPVPTLRPKLLWEAAIEIGERIELGTGLRGTRRMIPVLGGHFRGAGPLAGISGRVLAGGADRQLILDEDLRDLEAIYEMQSDAGDYLSIRNRLTVDTRAASRSAVSNITVAAAEGPFEFLSFRQIVGTLQPQRPAYDAVLIRAFEIVEAP